MHPEFTLLDFGETESFCRLGRHTLMYRNPRVFVRHLNLPDLSTLQSQRIIGDGTKHIFGRSLSFRPPSTSTVLHSDAHPSNSSVPSLLLLLFCDDDGGGVQVFRTIGSPPSAASIASNRPILSPPLRRPPAEVAVV